MDELLQRVQVEFELHPFELSSRISAPAERVTTLFPEPATRANIKPVPIPGPCFVVYIQSCFVIHQQLFHFRKIQHIFIGSFRAR
jgi:hypothetical protein